MPALLIIDPPWNAKINIRKTAAFLRRKLSRQKLSKRNKLCLAVTREIENRAPPIEGFCKRDVSFLQDNPPNAQADFDTEPFPKLSRRHKGLGC